METKFVTVDGAQPKQVFIQSGDTLLETLLRAKIDIDHVCGGNGTCGTCRVFVEKSGELSPIRNEIELEMAQDRGFTNFERLSCQIQPVSGMIIKLPTREL